MTSLRALTTLPWLPRLPALPSRGPHRYRMLLAATALALALAGAGSWYAIDVYRHAAASTAHAAEIARARASAATAARARGVPLSAATVAALDAAARAATRSQRVAASAHPAGLFGPHSWYVPPPLPPPVAYAPPLPFVFLGSYTPDGAASVFFLTRDDRVYDVKVGDLIDGIYEVTGAANGQLTFNYMPLNQQQSLSTGATR